jgi:uncharacterized repeat protein (TIGR03803 family)
VAQFEHQTESLPRFLVDLECFAMIGKRLIALCVPTLTVFVALLLLSGQILEAQTETVLYSFGGYAGDGANPFLGSLIFDKKGDLYGTTYLGGQGDGTVFELTAAGTEKILHPFGNMPDGSQPIAGLIFDKKGNLYGTTRYGGAKGGGTVFEWTAKGKYSVLYSFGSQPGDGQQPLGGLTFDKAGNLYGTTNAGWGAVFQLTPGGTEKVLYSFGPPPDGNTLSAGVTFDKLGNLYGVTSYGGGICTGGVANCGTLFELSPSGGSWIERIVHSFSGPPDGYTPTAAVIFKNGNLFGTTRYGGAFNEGTVFEWTAKGKYSVLYSFGSQPGDGRQPDTLIFDRKGNLFGTTFAGGTYDEGTVFELSPAGKVWTERVLYSFGSQPVDGRQPEAGLTFDKGGDLYGTTFSGGIYDQGTVFELIP